MRRKATHELFEIARQNKKIRRFCPARKTPLVDLVRACDGGVRSPQCQDAISAAINCLLRRAWNLSRTFHRKTAVEMAGQPQRQVKLVHYSPLVFLALALFAWLGSDRRDTLPVAIA
jgi:hypothetical protein